MANWYVDNTATGTNDGSDWTNAWHDFDHVVWGGAGVVAGDTLYISGGTVSKTYTGTTTSMLTVGVDGTSGSRITISPGVDAGHDGRVIFDCDSTSGIAINLNGHDYITITGVRGDAEAEDYNYGMRMINKAAYANGGYVYYSGGSCIGDLIEHIDFDGTGAAPEANDNCAPVRLGGALTANNEVRYCWIHGTSAVAPWESSGIIITGDTSLTNFTSNLIHHNRIEYLYHDGILTYNASVYHNHLKSIAGSTHSDAIVSTYPGYIKVFDNFFEDFNEQGIFFTSITAATCKEHYVYNNVFKTAVGQCIVLKNTLATSYIDGVYIYNNTFIGGGSEFFRCNYPGVTNLYIKNNVFGPNVTAGNAPVTILEPSTAFPAVSAYDYNVYDPTVVTTPDLAYLVATFYTLAELQAAGYETHGVYDTPDIDANGYLITGSPATGTGANLSVVFTTDKDGITRSPSGPWDMGAYANTSGPYARFY